MWLVRESRILSKEIGTYIIFYKVSQALIKSIKEDFTWQIWIHAIVGPWCNNMNTLLTTLSLFYERHLSKLQFNFLSVNECNDRISVINISRKLFVFIAAKIQFLGLPPIENCIPAIWNSQQCMTTSTE